MPVKRKLDDKRKQVHAANLRVKRRVSPASQKTHYQLKPAPLTPEEWDIMRRHPVMAHKLLSLHPYLRAAIDIPYNHHEKWDGTGYPRGLRGEQIPLTARLFAIVDVWDALTSDRPYRRAWSPDQTRESIRSESGKHFEPHIVDVFFEILAVSERLA